MSIIEIMPFLAAGGVLTFVFFVIYMFSSMNASIKGTSELSEFIKEIKEFLAIIFYFSAGTVLFGFLFWIRYKIGLAIIKGVI